MLTQFTSNHRSSHRSFDGVMVCALALPPRLCNGAEHWTHTLPSEATHLFTTVWCYVHHIGSVSSDVDPIAVLCC